MLMKTADGTVDASGKAVGSPSKDHRNLQRLRAVGPRVPHGLRGRDGQGRRHDRLRPPPAVTWPHGATATAHRVDRLPRRRRPTWTASALRRLPPAATTPGASWPAFDFDGEKLKRRWVFDSASAGPQWAGQGNHNLSVADVDGDQKDEIVFGSMTVDDDGEGLYSTTPSVVARLDSTLHVSDLDVTGQAGYSQAFALVH
ncbi:hypothetical protein GCM10020219_020570 [Nonomuraea dietziae]